MMNFGQESLMVIRVVRLLSSQYPAQQPNIIIIIMFVIIIVVFSVVAVFIMIIITYHYGELDGFSGWSCFSVSST